MLAGGDLRGKLGEDIELEGRSDGERRVGVRGGEGSDAVSVDFGDQKAGLAGQGRKLGGDAVEAVVRDLEMLEAQAIDPPVGPGLDAERDRADRLFEAERHRAAPRI